MDALTSLGWSRKDLNAAIDSLRASITQMPKKETVARCSAGTCLSGAQIRWGGVAVRYVVD